MICVFDLDDTIIQTTTLNNDAYNYALEKFGYPRINTKERITKNDLAFIPTKIRPKILYEKLKYFTKEWLPYRTVLNTPLIERITRFGKKDVRRILSYH